MKTGWTISLIAYALVWGVAAEAGWYLMVPIDQTPQHAGSYDTAAECQADIPVRSQRLRDLMRDIEASLAQRRAQGETISEGDVQLIALQSAARVRLGLMIARCEVRP